MKRLIAFSFIAIMFLFFTKSYSQTWTPLEMHAGGKVTGIIGHPTDANTVYARTDVAGIYKSSNRGDDWDFWK